MTARNTAECPHTNERQEKTMLTHWKKLTNPDYLGAYAFDKGEEKTVTIANVGREIVMGAEGKKEECTVAHFREPGMKPMILNATNCKAISKLYGTAYIEEWAGKRIILRVQQIKAFGEVVDAVRIKPEIPPAPAAPDAPLCADCKAPIRGYDKMPPAQVADYARRKYGRPLCTSCAAKAKGAADLPHREVPAADPSMNEEEAEE